MNNAGIQHVSPIEDFPIERYQQIIALNMNSVFYASKAVFRKMKDQKLVGLLMFLPFPEFELQSLDLRTLTQNME